MANRTFFAVDSPASERPRLEKISMELASMGAKPAQPGNLHITALFLGENVEDKTIAKAKKVLSETRFNSFECSISGLGVFTEKDPRVVFANISSGSEQFSKLNSMLRSALGKAGVETEARYHPHLTLAHVKRDTDVDSVMDLVRSSKEPEFSFACKELKLKRSRDSSEGTVYEDLASIPLL